jgi:Uma2 family endonuclease
MKAMPASGTMTADEYLALPEAQLGRPWNLVEGEVVVTDPTREHQRIAGEIYYELESWARTTDGGGEVSLPIDVQIDTRNVYAPDVLWYSADRTLPDPRTRPQPVPDLAVEVHSPSTWRHDLGAKKAGYERTGVRELWLVDTPARSVLVFRRSKPEAPDFDVTLELAAAETLVSPLLPGFALPVERLFHG